MFMSTLEQSILRTLVFFDLLNHPLTVLEIQRFLHGRRMSVGELMSALDSLVEAGIIKTREGLFFIKERDHIAMERCENELARSNSWKRVSSVMNIFLANPWIKAVAVCNSLAFASQRNESDIDILVVAKEGRVWLARLFSALPLKLLRLRPGETNLSPVCLSFFVDENSLDFTELLIENDIYFAHWLSSLVFIIDRSNIREDIFDANPWVREMLRGGAQPVMLSLEKDGFVVSLIRSVVRLFGNPLFENFSRLMQIWYMPKVIKDGERSNGTAVVLGKNIIKTHLNDRRQELTSRFHERLSRFYNNQSSSQLTSQIESQNYAYVQTPLFES